MAGAFGRRLRVHTQFALAVRPKDGARHADDMNPFDIAVIWQTHGMTFAGAVADGMNPFDIAVIWQTHGMTFAGAVDGWESLISHKYVAVAVRSRSDVLTLDVGS